MSNINQMSPSENFDTTVVIPAFNEVISLKEFLPELVDSCVKNCWKVIIVNDGSSDQTKSVLDHYANHDLVEIINHKVNKGYGGALKSGIMAAETDYIITIDADGQHNIEDIRKMKNYIQATDADMVVGKRDFDGNMFRTIGKKVIRFFANLLMKIPVKDLNSGMKIYRTELVQKYIKHCPNGMAFSDIITLLFIYNNHLVLEIPIKLNERKHGRSTISFKTAFSTIYEILNIVLMFNPIRVFLPAGLVFILSGIAWGIPIALEGKGISVGASLTISIGIIIIFFGLLAEQISQIRKQL